MLIWITILEIVAERQKPLLFVTGEEKADWQHRSDNRGVLPRIELADEFRRKSSGNSFYIASLSGLLKLFEAPSPVVSEVREQEIRAKAVSVSSASVKVNLVEGLEHLVDLGVTDPRAAIRQSWLLLGKTVLRAANVLGDNVEPNSPEILTSLRRLESSVQFSDRVISSIKDLHAIAIRVFYQSEWAYSPTQDQAERFITYSAAARADLGEEVK